LVTTLDGSIVVAYLSSGRGLNMNSPLTRPGSTGLIAITTLLAAAALGIGLWLLMIRMPGSSYTGAFEPSGAERESARRLERDVRTLAREIGERSVWNPSGLAAAAAHIEQVLAGLGYTLESHSYESHGQTVRNIEATRSGTSHPGEIILVGAHYDSLVGTVGANDNASGVAAVLETARLLAGQRFSRTLRFVAFVNEEPPHFNVGDTGSHHYAKSAARRGDNIVAMFSLETIGYYSEEPGSQRYPFPLSLFYPNRGNFIAFVGNITSRRLVHRSLEVFRETTQFPSEGVASPEWIPGVSWSDHASFWPYGYPAIMVTDTAPYRYPYYHTAGDQPEHIDYARTARVVAGIAGVVSELAAKNTRVESAPLR